MDLYFEVGADRSGGTREQQRGAFRTDYLGDDGARGGVAGLGMRPRGDDGVGGNGRRSHPRAR